MKKIMSAHEASEIALEARTISNFGMLCNEIAKEINQAAKRGCLNTKIYSALLLKLNSDEEDVLINLLKTLGYTTKWENTSNIKKARLYISWEVEE